MTYQTKIVSTQDESTTLLSEQFGEHYHSIFGAKNESQFIYINAGLSKINQEHISVFEMGMGTGLNALLSLEYAQKHHKQIEYHTIEKFPISEEIAQQLCFNSPLEKYLPQIHSADWNTATNITAFFRLHKYHQDIQDFTHTSTYDIIFYDAFSYDTQPELWSVPLFQKIYNALNEGGLLLSYSVKGVIKRNLRACGFKVKRLKGPEGKREILMAIK